MASGSGTMRVLIAVHGDSVATRFDLCTEVMIAEAEGGTLTGEPRTMLLSGPSAYEICGIAIKENVSVLVAGGMEEEHYEYLRWKKIKVVDRVIGRADDAVGLLIDGRLAEGSIIRAGADGETPG